MYQSRLKSYCLGLEEIENWLQSQYGSRIQPVNYTKLEEFKIKRARSVTVTASLKKEKVGTDAPKQENIDR